MAASSKRGTGIVVVGLALAILGLVFVIAGKSAIGIVNAALGVVFIVIGAGTARKASAPNERR